MTMPNQQKYLLVVSALLVGGSHSFQNNSPRTALVVGHQQHRFSPMKLDMQPASRHSKNQDKAKNNVNKRRRDSLSAVSISEDWTSERESSLKKRTLGTLQQDLSRNSLMESTILPVLSTSLLITGNTVGASMLVLPELAAGPGMAISTSIFLGAFIVNLISGLLIAQVAIHQHDASGSDVPSSFKDFAQANLPTFGSAVGDDSSNSMDWSANFISGISVLVNALVLAFNTAKVGDFGSSTLEGLVPAEMISIAWAVACVALVGTQTFTSLSTITSVLVFGLFTSFAGLLLPGLASMTTSPMDLLLHTSGTSPDVLGSALQLAPIMLMSLVYQNIVPTVVKMLDYDRRKSAAAIALGSVLPLGMYIAWTFCILGGGGGAGAAGSTGGLEGPLMTAFTLATIAGSSIGCVMSLAEEFDSFVKADTATTTKDTATDSEEESDDDKFSMTSVLASVACTGVALQFFANDLNGALSLAGSFGSPLLYGVLPVIMVYTQQQQQAKVQHFPAPPLPTMEESETTSFLGLPTASWGLLGVASTGFVGNELLQSAQDVMSMAML